MAQALTVRDRAVLWLAASWGFCVFMPVGVGYLHLLLLWAALLAHPERAGRLAQVVAGPWRWVLLFFVCWPLVVLAVGPRFDESGARMFHVVRAVLTLGAALMLNPKEARAAIGGFLLAAGVAAVLVLLHHAVGLPVWTIWANLLENRGNQSSQNMILLAAASACAFALAIRKADPQQPVTTAGRAAWAGAAVLWMGTLALHAQSRNSLLVLAVGLLLVAFHRLRSWRGIVAGVAAACIVGALAWQFSPNVSARFRTAVAELEQSHEGVRSDTSVGVRWRMWGVATRAMLAEPLTGAGLGAWLPHWQQAAADLTNGMANTNNPHNDYLLWGMETGVPGLLGVAALLGLFVWLAWGVAGHQGAMALVFASVLFITAVFNAPLRDAAFGLSMLWLTGASAVAAGLAGRHRGKTRPHASK